jgi:hypothetical protein
VSELYYAEMEAHRNDCEESYFEHRKADDSPHNRRLWRAGFERGFQTLWKDPAQPETGAEHG